jgi:hypothetical protein
MVITGVGVHGIGTDACAGRVEQGFVLEAIATLYTRDHQTVS